MVPRPNTSLPSAKFLHIGTGGTSTFSGPTTICALSRAPTKCTRPALMSSFLMSVVSPASRSSPWSNLTTNTLPTLHCEYSITLLFKPPQRFLRFLRSSRSFFVLQMLYLRDLGGGSGGLKPRRHPGCDIKGFDESSRYRDIL